MAKRILLLLLLLLSPWLVLGVLAGALAVSGVLTGERAQLMLDVLKGKISAETIEKADVQVTGDVARRTEELDARQADIEKQRESVAVFEGQLDARLKSIRSMEADIAARRRTLINRIEQFNAEKAAWEAARKAETEAMAATDFQKAVKNFQTMQPRDAARLFYNYEDGLALRFLRQFNADTSSAILAAVAKLDAEKNNRDLPVGPDRPAEHNRAAIWQRLLAEPDKAPTATAGTTPP